MNRIKITWTDIDFRLIFALIIIMGGCLDLFNVTQRINNYYEEDVIYEDTITLNNYNNEIRRDKVMPQVEMFALIRHMMISYVVILWGLFRAETWFLKKNNEKILELIDK